MTDQAATSTATANIGVVGLAVMGSNLARNLASREGNTVAIFNRSADKTEHLVAEHPEAGFVATFSYEEFAASLTAPRAAIIMVKAGAGTALRPAPMHRTLEQKLRDAKRAHKQEFKDHQEQYTSSIVIQYISYIHSTGTVL